MIKIVEQFFFLISHDFFLQFYFLQFYYMFMLLLYYKILSQIFYTSCSYNFYCTLFLTFICYKFPLSCKNFQNFSKYKFIPYYIYYYFDSFFIKSFSSILYKCMKKKPVKQLKNAFFSQEKVKIKKKEHLNILFN